MVSTNKHFTSNADLAAYLRKEAAMIRDRAHGASTASQLTMRAEAAAYERSATLIEQVASRPTSARPSTARLTLHRQPPLAGRLTVKPRERRMATFERSEQIKREILTRKNGVWDAYDQGRGPRRWATPARTTPTASHLCRAISIQHQ